MRARLNPEFACESMDAVLVFGDTVEAADIQLKHGQTCLDGPLFMTKMLHRHTIVPTALLPDFGTGYLRS